MCIRDREQCVCGGKQAAAPKGMLPGEIYLYSSGSSVYLRKNCLLYTSYIGLEAVEPGDVIVQGGVSYRVRSSRAYWLGDAVHHWWALLEREREAAKMCIRDRSYLAVDVDTSAKTVTIVL